MNIHKNLWLSVALLLLTACHSKQNNSTETLLSETNTAQTMEDSISGATGTDSTKMNNTTKQPDAVSAATSVANVATFNGVLTIPPQNYATVTLTMAGTVRTANIYPGDYVKKGALLATLENPEFINLQQSYLDSHAQVEFFEKEFQRQQTLAEGEVASQKKLQQSKADYLSMKSRQDAAAAQLSLLGVSAKALLTNGISPLLAVKAPISGYVGKVQLNLGKHIAEGETLCEIVDKSKTMLCITTYEKDLMKIKVGDAVQFRVNGLGEQVFNAVLVSVGQQVDRNSRSLEVYARVIENNPLFRPGMYITARINKK